jgi:hypothetical protein
VIDDPGFWKDLFDLRISSYLYRNKFDVKFDFLVIAVSDLVCVESLAICREFVESLVVCGAFVESCAICGTFVENLVVCDISVENPAICGVNLVLFFT